MAKALVIGQGLGSFAAGVLTCATLREEAKDSGPHSIKVTEGEVTVPVAVEVFHNPRTYRLITDGPKGEELAHGWYWWPCMPGCLPDADALGPFATSTEALANAREMISG